MNDRDNYFKKIETKLDEWDSDIEELTDKLKTVSADATIVLNSKLKQLSKKRNEISDKLEELRDASEDTWEDVRDDIESTWKQVSTEFDNLANRLKS
ncbi:hypothetical protein W03_21540 [Nitrosomonas sp. PY1]|uniref:apolipoprotein A1/A4/E family protein n=1 Tax=Nitrosomonas sp. PY1 TaxID=1803906 RepID=UPI001FC885A2|nr:apolipoprotein A1/A4/E family protein [Nitrosomonas sp. PY1]GKS70150.1 hypothetical protein W03_21540 [Nitrosomonas sp. PY1]